MSFHVEIAAPFLHLVVCWFEFCYVRLPLPREPFPTDEKKIDLHTRLHISVSSSVGMMDECKRSCAYWPSIVSFLLLASAWGGDDGCFTCFPSHSFIFILERHFFVVLFFSQATTRMEERLDDAINVLRNHAESMIGPQAGAGAPGQGPGPSPSLSHSNGIMAAYTPVLEPHMVKTRNKNKAKQLFTLNWNWNFRSFFCCRFSQSVACSPWSCRSWLLRRIDRISSMTILVLWISDVIMNDDF